MAPKLGLHLSPQQRMETSRPGDTSEKTTSSYWSSLKSMVVTSRATMRTFTHRTDYETRPSRRRSHWHDPESGVQMDGPVVFNNRLDMPSIGSTTGGRSSRSSREEDHRGLENAIFDASMESMNVSGTTCTPMSSKEDDELRERKDSVMQLD